MAAIDWTMRPPASVTASTHTVMVAAFEGWNDGGESATDALEHLWDQWGAQQVATIPPDEHVDFTITRPTLSVSDGVPGRIQWPHTQIGWCSPTPSMSIVLVRGPEPEFAWPKWSTTVLDAADELGVSTVITLGAMLSDVPHTRPAPVFGAAHDEHILDEVALPRSNYEGPVGIPSVLLEFAHSRGFEALGLWAAVPGYAAGVPSVKGALALLDVLERVLGADIDTTTGFAEAADEYTNYLDGIVGEDPDTSEYVANLEEAYDRADEMVLGSHTNLVVEVENFLRDQ
ncbi:MAG: PAC2 family protein [Microthrixaceae bacterium]|nr:PAC2 family protein [Microthrixaceae bacterium]